VQIEKGTRVPCFLICRKLSIRWS